LLAVGVGGLAFGTVEALRYNSKNDEISSTCGPSTRCPTPEAHAQYLTLHDEAISARTFAWVGFGVGTAALATSLILVLTEPPRESRKAFIVPSFGHDAAAISWVGSW
jgi:hypothetical protein